MLCEKCGKNEATVYYTETVNGKTTKYMLCHDCAEEMKSKSGIFPTGGFGGLMSEMFSDMFAPFSTKVGRLRGDVPSADEKKCPVCGATMSDIAHERKVGCPECYRTFKSELAYTIERVHGGQKYKGDGGTEGKGVEKAGSEAAALKRELDEAVKSENFELAAELRDKIRELSQNEKKEEN